MYKKDIGRKLTHDILELGLKAGNRLEPSPHLIDVGRFEYQDVPFKAVFWVGRPDARILHGCPLNLVPGFSIERWCIDLMHAWHLGPLQNYIATCFFFFLETGLWFKKVGWLRQEEIDKLALLHLKAELFEYYKTRRETDARFKSSGTEIWNLTLNMLGKKDNPTLSAKAKETHGILQFIVDTFEKHGARIKELENFRMTAALLHEAGKAALQIDDVLDSPGRKFELEQSQHAFEVYLRFATLYQRAGGKMVQKFHLMIHLFQDTIRKGNPRSYSTYRDETINRIIAAIARSCHRQSWTESIFRKMNIMYFKGSCYFKELQLVSHLPILVAFFCDEF